MSLPALANETWYALRLGTVEAVTAIVDLSRGVVLAVGQGGLKGVFRDACNRPLIGRPRRPKVVQVVDDAARGELKGAMPGVAIEVAPLPEGVELRVRAHLRHQIPHEGPATWGYSREVFEGVLALAEDLLSAQPWQFLCDLDLLTIRAPDHGIDDGVLLVLGNAGRQFGFLVFPTRELAEEFRVVSHGSDAQFHAAKLSGSHFAFTFEGSEIVPQPMRQAAHRAGFEGPRYPLPGRISADLYLAIAREAEAAILLAAGRALAEMTVQEEDKLAGMRPALVEYDGVILLYHGVEPAPAEVVAIHGGPVDAPPDDEGASWRAQDFALLPRLTALADETLGVEWRASAALLDADLSSPVHGLVLWPTLLAEPRGASTALAELRLRHAATFDTRTDAILAAEAVTWNGLWEVRSIVRGQGFEARDLFTHEARFVRDVAASYSLQVRTVLCARIPTIGEVSWIAASDAHGLGPYHADRVRTALAEQFRWPKTRAVPIGKVLAARAQREVARAWQEAVAAALSAPPPEVRSPDGEVIQVVKDSYRISLPDLTKVEGAERTFGVGSPRFVRTGDGPFAMSDVSLHSDGLDVESMSIAQADRVRARLQAAFGDALGPVERQVRSLADEVAGRPPAQGAGLQAVPPEVEQRAVQEYKANHYATWPDVPLPALDGKTPRQAATQERTRAKLERLIDDMEHDEQLSAPGTAYDFDILRRILRLMDQDRARQ